MNLPRQRILGTTELPLSAPGMRIGLFGGSFNPVHEGHRLVALQMLRRLRLDAVWLLVSPGNPLKDHRELAPLAERVAGARKLMRHPRIKVTGFEAEHGFRFTYDTLRFLTGTLPGRRFVWIMGTDNMVSFHKWDRWREIAGLVPMAVYGRPGTAHLVPASKAAIALERFRIDEAHAELLPLYYPPAWAYLRGTVSSLSSSALRAARNHKQ